MKSTGMIRKIDELGRIVIPKEIRTSLNIKDNDNLEIYIEEDKMILKKYNKLMNFEESVTRYLKVFNKIFNLNILITDTNKVIFVSNKDISYLKDLELTKELTNIIKERKNIIEKNVEKLKWFKDKPILSTSVVFPLINNTELMGAIILIKDKKLSDYEVALIRLLTLLIKENIE